MTAAGFVRFVRALRVALFGVPHRHRWETFKEVKVYAEGDDPLLEPPIHRDFHLRCRGCGDVMKRRL